MSFVWRGDMAKGILRAEARRRVAVACAILEGDIKQSMKLGGRTPSGKTIHLGGKDVDPETGEEASTINTYRSKPGEAPRVQTGWLRSHIVSEMHPILAIGRVGVDLEAVVYARALEFGYDPSNLLPRPYIRPALARCEARIRAIFSMPIPGL